MKNIIYTFILSLIITFSVTTLKAQVYYRPNNYGMWLNRVRIDSLLALPIKHPGDTIINGLVGAIMYSALDTSLYVTADGKHYVKIKGNSYSAGYNLTLTGSTFAVDSTQTWIFNGIKNKGGYYSPDSTGTTSYILLGTVANPTSPNNTPFINLGGGKLFYNFNHLQITDNTGNSNTGGVKSNDIAANYLSTYGNQVHTISLIEAFNPVTNNRWGIFSVGQYTAIQQKNTVLLSLNTNDSVAAAVLSIRRSPHQVGNLLEMQDTLANIGAHFDAQGVYYPKQWTTSTRPTVTEGASGYNLSLHQMEYWNGSSWVAY